jgi:hypothetical protein
LLNEAYREDCRNRTQCFEWFKHFEEGRMSVGEDPKPGRPSTSTKVTMSREFVLWLRKSLFNCPRSSRQSGHQHRIFPSNFTEKLQMRHISAKFVLHLLTHCSSSTVIWLNLRHPLCPMHPILWTYPWKTFSCFPNLKLERKLFPNHRGDSGKCNKRYAYHHRKCVP